MVVVLAAVLGGCDSVATTDTTPQPSSNIPTTLSPEGRVTTVGSAPEPREFFLRECSSNIYSEPHDDSFGRSLDAIGPVQFLQITTDAPATPGDQLRPDENGGYEGQKYVTVISGAAVGPVSVSIAPKDLYRARLVYDPDRWDSPTLDEGDRTVRFEVCPGRDAQYNGGFIVDGPACIEVVVIDEGADDSPAKSTIPFGLPDCADAS